MTLKRVLGASLICAASAGLVHAADDYDKRWYLAPGVNYTFTDGSSSFDRPADENMGGTLALGRALSRHWNLDLRVTGANMGGIPASAFENTEMYTYGVDFLYFPTRNSIAPYFGIGVGAAYHAIAGDSTTNPILDWTLGLQSQIANYGAAIRAELRYRVDFFELTSDETNEYGEFVPSISLVLPLGVDQSYTDRSQQALTNVDTRWHLGIAGLWTLPDSDRDPTNNVEVDPGPGVAISVGRAVSESWNTEFRLFSSRLDLNPSNAGQGGEIDMAGLMVDFQYFFNRNPRFSPYLEMGLGVMRSEIGGRTSTGPAFEAGAGFITRFTENGTGLRMGVRYRAEPTDYNDSTRGVQEFGDVEFHAGLYIPLGQRATVTPPLSTGLDSDLDGVPDDNDACPNSFPGAVVDARGCEIDSDGDGVVDSADRCPNTPRGMQVGPDGCTTDSDQDGVADAVDKCPNTPPGQTVDVDGCPVAEVVVVRFAVDSSVLTADSKAKLDQVARQMVQRSYVVAVLGGHADSTGAAEYNRKLSLRRANAVKAYLVARGVRDANLTVRGFGESQPVADNGTAAGRAMNRRVEVQVINP